MAKKTGNQVTSPRTFGRRELELAIRNVKRRIDDLKSFDVSAVRERFDPYAVALEDKISATLADIFGEGTSEYRRHLIGSLDTLPMSMMDARYSLAEIQAGYHKGIRDAGIQLVSLLDLLSERLADMGEEQVQESAPQAVARPSGKRVFIVHGRDEAAKESVARFVARLGLDPIILHEQPNAGRTIIEKLEGHMDVDFAIVILTPDDVGSLCTDAASTRPRARQNVVLELGLFIGAIGRQRVCAIHRGNLELPSDYEGVIYVPMDEGGGWRLLLAREMQHAGLEVDLNKAI